MKFDREKIVPHLRQKANLQFTEVQGRVYPARDFAAKFKRLLNPNERKIVESRIEELGIGAKDLFRQPLASSQSVNGLVENKKTLVLRRVGARSAYWPAKQLKFKGCRLAPSGLCFPHEKLEFGQEQMSTTKITFGVLTAENVMREILAFCFLSGCGIGTMQRPLAVFEYRADKKAIGYCLVSASLSEKRLESEEMFYGLYLKELIMASELEKKLGISILGDLENFASVDNEWYAENKSELMIKMNFNGGFRGVLNSNVGNDIVHGGRFYICDFDTFTVIGMPKRPNYKFIKGFVLWCVVEMLKSSPLVFAYLDMDGLDSQEAAKKIWEIYAQKSLLWQKYQRKFILKAQELEWNMRLVEKAFAAAIATPVFFDMIQDNIVTSSVIKNTYKPEMSFYTKQG